jgi:hypothetical protein
MTRGDRVTWQGDVGTVEGYTSDELSVVIRLDDGTRVYAPLQLTLVGVTARADAHPCASRVAACSGRGAGTAA